MRRFLPGMAALGALVITAPAQASFAPEGSPLAVGAAQPYGVVTADFNRDGRLDVATVNGTGSNLSVFLRGPGGFAAEAGLAVRHGPRSRVRRRRRFQRRRPSGRRHAELQQRHRQRPAAPAGRRVRRRADAERRRGHRLGHRRGLQRRRARRHRRAELHELQHRHLPQQRQHGFTLEGTNATGATPRDVAAADFNGDGRPDLAISNLGAGTVTVLLRNPANTGFASEAAAIPVGASPEGIKAADFNGDGRPDIAVAVLGTNTVNVLLRKPARRLRGRGADPGRRRRARPGHRRLQRRRATRPRGDQQHRRHRSRCSCARRAAASRPTARRCRRPAPTASPRATSTATASRTSRPSNDQANTLTRVPQHDRTRRPGAAAPARRAARLRPSRASRSSCASCRARSPSSTRPARRRRGRATASSRSPARVEHPDGLTAIDTTQGPRSR